MNSKTQRTRTLIYTREGISSLRHEEKQCYIFFFQSTILCFCNHNNSSMKLSYMSLSHQIIVILHFFVVS